MKDCAVVIPIYKLPLPEGELYVLKRNLLTLKNWPVVFILPSRLSAEWQASPSISTLGTASFFPDRYFNSVDGYNELLLNIRFYWRFRAFQKILICQLDAIAVSDELQYWCDKPFSYIGAPWVDGFSVPTLPYKLLGVGNGGFSLRRIAHFLRLLSIPRVIRTEGGSPALIPPSKWVFFGRKIRGPIVQEDAFWSLMKDTYPWFTTPDPQTALKFSFEVAPRHMFELNGHRMPFGGHAWEKYDPEFWLERLPDLTAAFDGESPR